LPRVRTTTPTSQELSLKSFAWTSSDSACHQLRLSSRMPKPERDRSTRSFWSVDLLVFQRSSRCSLISSMARP
jgi:hypothetical protein